MKLRWLVPATLPFSISVFSGLHYRAIEKLGVHRRDIMVARVRAARMVRNDRED